MNSYNFGLIGSVWLMVILLLVAFALTIFTYKETTPPISKFFKWLLISLRSLTLFLLILILFEPVLDITSNLINKPKVAVLLDNSLSMNINTEKYKKSDIYKNVLTDLDLSGLEYKVYSFGEKVNEIDVATFEKSKYESLKLNENITDLARGIKHVNRNLENENFSSLLLITDGIHNQGNSPIINAQELARPIFTIGIGDTNKPKDIAITNILTNKIGFLDSKLPLIVKFKSAGYDNQKVKLTIFENGKKIEEKEITINANQTEYEEYFTYLPIAEGTNKISATIQNLTDELTTANNSSSEYVKINKNKRKFLIIAGAPNPDITFIKAELSKIKNVEIKEFIQKQKSDFYITPNQKDFSESEMLILIGYPNNFSPDNVTKMIKNELDNGKSLIFVPSKDVNFKKATILEDYLGFKVLSNSPRESNVSPITLEQGQVNSVLKVDDEPNSIKLWNDLPPLFHSELFVKTNPTASVLMQYRIGDVEFQEPLLLSNEFNKTKSLIFLGYGLYKWKFGSYSSEKDNNANDLFNILINNTIKWLSVENIGKNFTISTSKEKYNLGETVEILAQVYDKSYNAFDKAKVNITLQTKNSEKREITLQNYGNGKYITKVSGLKNGDYQVYGTAYIDSQTEYAKDQTRFEVELNSLEKSNIVLNKSLLLSISTLNNGKYYDANNFKLLNEDIKKSDFHFEKSMTTKKEIVLWNYSILLIIIITALGLEWFIRKRLGLL